MAKEDFDLLRHFNVNVNAESLASPISEVQTNHQVSSGNGQFLQRSLAGEFADVASGRRQLGSELAVHDDYIGDKTPLYLIAHHRRLRHQSGHMDNSMNPRLGHVPVGRKQHAGQKLEDNFDKGMVPMAGSETPLIAHPKYIHKEVKSQDCSTFHECSPSYNRSNLSNTGMTPKLGSCQDDFKSHIQHAGRDTESKLMSQSLIPTSLENEQKLVQESIAYAGHDTKSNIQAHENGMYPAKDHGY